MAGQRNSSGMVLLLPQPWGLEHILPGWRDHTYHLPSPPTSQLSQHSQMLTPHFRTTTSGLGLFLPSASTEMLSVSYLPAPEASNSSEKQGMLVWILNPE